MLYAFDLLEIDGEGLRPLPLSDRKRKLMKLVGKRRVGIVLSAHRRGRRLDLSAGARDGARQTGRAELPHPAFTRPIMPSLPAVTGA
jgi:ATP-dependent DNA ligase